MATSTIFIIDKRIEDTKLHILYQHRAFEIMFLFFKQTIQTGCKYIEHHLQSPLKMITKEQ